MQPKAVNNFVFVLQSEAESEKSGLLMVGSGKEKPNKGTIFSVGDCVQDNNIKTSEGKTCLFFKGTGFNVEYDSKEYLVLTGEQIIAIV